MISMYFTLKKVQCEIPLRQLKSFPFAFLAILTMEAYYESREVRFPPLSSFLKTSTRLIRAIAKGHQLGGGVGEMLFLEN